MQGYRSQRKPCSLECITSVEENQFVTDLVSPYTGSIHIGAYQPAGSAEPAGDWR